MTNAVELDFADGRRLVPDYLADMMVGIQTERYTYDRAVELANNAMLGGHLGRVQQSTTREHFEGRDGHRR